MSIASITLAGAEVSLFDRYGRETLEPCFDELIVHSERRIREEIGKIPDGVYRHEEVILEDGERGGPYRLCLKLTVAGCEMTFDFTGTDPQIPGPINAPLSATYAATFYVVRCIGPSERYSRFQIGRRRLPLHGHRRRRV